jgi:hypothetical protein
MDEHYIVGSFKVNVEVESNVDLALTIQRRETRGRGEKQKWG